MRFKYCPFCGRELIKKEIGDEGLIPYCEDCKIPLWDMFSTCVICAVVNEENEVALLRQDYVSKENYVCVAGVMKLGETAEEAAAREIEEETGLKPYKLEFVKSYPFEKKEMLMLGFKAYVKKADFVLSQEVDEAKWFKFDEALKNMRNGSIAWQLVKAAAEN